MTITTTIVTAAGSFFNREEYYATLTAFPKVPLIIVGGFLLALLLIVYGLQPTPSPPLELLQELLLPAMIQTLPFRRRTTTTTTTRDKNTEKEEEVEETLTIHLIVLVPGLLSPPTGMGNTKIFLDQLARQYNHCASFDGDSSPNKKHMIVFRSNSNLGWETTEGILTCGERLAEEINTILKGFAKTTDTNHHPPITKINLSLIGNSLGGLISRAALPRIHWNTASNSKIRIVPKLFSTTNTPHLGSKHCSTVVVTNLPRLLQKLIDVSLAKVFKRTGDDLFWFSDTMELLNNDPEYLQPLAAFEQRIAYGNCFRTDLQVPAASSLFLSKTSRSVHQTISTTTSTTSSKTNNATDYFDTQNFPFAIHAVKTTTPANTTTKAHDATKDGDKNDTTNNYQYHNHQCTDDIEDWMKLYCENLDSLGWIKVFCDTRSVLPYLPIPTMLQMVLTGHEGTTTTTTTTTKTKKDDFFLLERLDHISEWTSSCLFHAYHLQHGQHLHNHNTISTNKDTMDNDGDDPSTTNGRLLPERWYPPMAHNILMATMSKTPKYLGGEYYAQRGMPFVEEYAKRIVQQCTSTAPPATTTTTTTDKKTN